MPARGQPTGWESWAPLPTASRAPSRKASNPHGECSLGKCVHFPCTITNYHNPNDLKRQLVITSQFLGFRILKHNSPGSSAWGLTGHQGVSWPGVSSGSWTREGFQDHAGGWQDSFSCSYRNESSGSSVAAGQGLSPAPTGAHRCLLCGPLRRQSTAWFPKACGRAEASILVRQSLVIT